MVTRRTIIGSSISLLGFTHAVPQAQSRLPTGSIELSVAFGAGSSTDAAARVVAQGLSQRLNRPVLVVNRPGANGNIAIQALRNALPNGQQILFHVNGVASDQATRKDRVFDVRKDIAPLTKIAEGNFGLFIHPSIPVQNAREFIEYARKNPGKLHYGSSGAGGTGHLTWEYIKWATNVDIVHVPFATGGSASSLNALLAGEVHAVINEISTFRLHEVAGKLRALAMVSRHRAEAMPNIPTISEQNITGLERFASSLWLGTFMHINTPEPIVNEMAREINAMLEIPEIQERFRSLGFNTNMIGGTKNPSEFKEFIASEVELAERVVKLANIPLR